jgi:hypothetical protein
MMTGSARYVSATTQFMVEEQRTSKFNLVRVGRWRSERLQTMVGNQLLKCLVVFLTERNRSYRECASCESN